MIIDSKNQKYLGLDTNETNTTAATPSQSDRDLESEKNKIHSQTSIVLLRAGLPQDKLDYEDVRIPTVLYLVYWTHRLRNNSHEQDKVREHLLEYLRPGVDNPSNLVDTLLADDNVKILANRYTKNLLLPTKTVDLLITKAGSGDQQDKELLLVPRNYFPLGLSLPGGFILETDEDNPLGLPANLYAALRVAGDKVLGLASNAQYCTETDEKGRCRYIVRGATDYPSIIIHAEDGSGYRVREKIDSVFRPSDPRHIVDTIAFRCEIIGDVEGNCTWTKKSMIMSPEVPAGGLAFQHHREIISHITAQTSLENEQLMTERDLVRSIIANPLQSYQNFQNRFQAHNNPRHAPMPELFPIVDRLLSSMFDKEINSICKDFPVFTGIRDKAANSLRHVCLKNRDFCSYDSTLTAIAKAVSFFDLVALHKKGVFEQMPKDVVVEHDPRTTPYAKYHMYRYEYRMNELMSMIPTEIIIPTFESLSATDLMKVRGVPIRFVGLSTDFLYVDEFDQSPEEFYMHDVNHSFRMSLEDGAYMKRNNITPEELHERSCGFIARYLNHIKLNETDLEEEREIKKLKKIILFEIVHEDARPFLQDVICEYIQQMEGGSVPFEVPRIDPDTKYMDVVDTLDTGISTLSYVRNKLQHGFYDHIDAQTPQIVGLKYRTAAWIARAAYEMLVELEAEPSQYAELDEEGHVSYEWLLRRTCSVGPDNIHRSAYEDSDLEVYGDEASRLNPKRYQSPTV